MRIGDAFEHRLGGAPVEGCAGCDQWTGRTRMVSYASTLSSGVYFIL